MRLNDKVDVDSNGGTIPDGSEINLTHNSYSNTAVCRTAKKSHLPFWLPSFATGLKIDYTMLVI